MLKFLIIVIAGGVFIYYAYSSFEEAFGEDVEKNTPLACTMEAKMRPDGSGVGRTGTNCEFAICPGE